MLTQEDDVDAHALFKRGWTISAIARHLGHDRKTIRVYLNGERTAGVRAPAGVSPFEYERIVLRSWPRWRAIAEIDQPLLRSACASSSSSCVSMKQGSLDWLACCRRQQP